MAILVVVAGVAIWSDREAAGYYAYQPGSAPLITTSAACKLTGSGSLALADGSPCARIVVAPGRGKGLSGKLLMVDVLVGKATPLQWLLKEVHLLGSVSKGTQLIPAPAVLGSTPASQLQCQDTQDMRTASQTAPLVALQRLGYHVGADDLGAQVYLVVAGSAAAKAGVRCGDRITAIDGRPVGTATQVGTAIDGRRPGQAVTVTVRRTASHGSSTLHLRATLGPYPALDGQKAQPSKAFLGVQTMTDTVYRLPFDVSIQVGDIGGPSAGLALTLGVLDALSNGHLTGGKVVAATGTIDAMGNVGDVGGVAQKAVAVQRAGAVLFLVPPQEYTAARTHAGAGMRVVAVSTLSQALTALRAIGGQVPVPSPTRAG